MASLRIFPHEANSRQMRHPIRRSTARSETHSELSLRQLQKHFARRAALLQSIMSFARAAQGQSEADVRLHFPFCDERKQL